MRYHFYYITFLSLNYEFTALSNDFVKQKDDNLEVVLMHLYEAALSLEKILLRDKEICNLPEEVYQDMEARRKTMKQFILLYTRCGV